MFFYSMKVLFWPFESVEHLKWPQTGIWKSRARAEYKNAKFKTWQALQTQGTPLPNIKLPQLRLWLYIYIYIYTHIFLFEGVDVTTVILAPGVCGIGVWATVPDTTSIGKFRTHIGKFQTQIGKFQTQIGKFQSCWQANHAVCNQHEAEYSKSRVLGWERAFALRKWSRPWQCPNRCF